jgi:hypothetical protein
VILGVAFQMIRELPDAMAEDRDLDLRRTGISLCTLVLLNHFGLTLFRDRHALIRSWSLWPARHPSDFAASQTLDLLSPHSLAHQFSKAGESCNATPPVRGSATVWAARP